MRQLSQQVTFYGEGRGGGQAPRPLWTSLPPSPGPQLAKSLPNSWRSICFRSMAEAESVPREVPSEQNPAPGASSGQELTGLTHECGVFGCIATGQWPTQIDVAQVICLGLVALQHRYATPASAPTLCPN